MSPYRHSDVECERFPAVSAFFAIRVRVPAGCWRPRLQSVPGSPAQGPCRQRCREPDRAGARCAERGVAPVGARDKERSIIEALTACPAAARPGLPLPEGARGRFAPRPARRPSVGRRPTCKDEKRRGHEDFQRPGNVRPRQAVALRGGRPHRHTRLCLVATGLPSYRLRHQNLRERCGRAGEGGRRREPSDHERPPVRTVPDDPRLRVQPRPHARPDEARPRGPRQGQMGAHLVGRGIRPDCGEGCLLQGDLWRRVHPSHGRHWPRGRPHAAGIRPFSARHAERMLHAIGLLVLHSARGRHHLRAGRNLPRDGLRRRTARPLRRSGVHVAGAHRVLGQGAAAVQRRRPVRPCGH